MTPQQKLERLIELAKEAHELLKDLYEEESICALSLCCNTETSNILIANTKGFKEIYPNHDIEDYSSVSNRLSVIVKDVEVATYETKSLA